MSLGYDERKKLKEMLLESEANIPWMYCDSRGNVTVGIGHLIRDAIAATKLPFNLKGVAATPKQITD